MAGSPGLLSNLFRILRISTLYPSVHCFHYLNVNDWSRRITPMDPSTSPLEEIDRMTSLINSTDYTCPDSECNSSSNAHTFDESGAERKVVNDEELRDPNDPIHPDEPVIENIVNATDGTDPLFQTQFHLPPALRRFLTKKEIHLQLMREMHTTIKLPHNKRRDGKIVVTGRNETNVLATYRRIREVFTDSRRVLGPTHFVSIPMNLPNIRERFELFKKQVLECCASDQDNIEDALFTSAQKLHLTLCVLSVASEKEHDVARRRLNDCQKSVIEPLLKNRAITVQMRGIDVMSNDPTKTKVLYAKVESPDNILQSLADDVEAFYMMDNGSPKKNKQNRVHVKLHVTLMNSKFLKFGRKRPKNSKFKFDATNILKNFGEFDFGEVTVNTMHLSQMRSPSKDHYYTSSNTIQWA